MQTDFDMKEYRQACILEIFFKRDFFDEKTASFYFAPSQKWDNRRSAWLMFPLGQREVLTSMITYVMVIRMSI